MSFVNDYKMQLQHRYHFNVTCHSPLKIVDRPLVNGVRFDGSYTIPLCALML